MSSINGSTWNKWDLHVHTPDTKLSDNYVQESGKDKWETYCEVLENSDVEVIGITDYFSILNYNKFLSIFRKKYPQSKKVFFPNIEFRIDSKNSKSEHIQVHIVFSNKENTLGKIQNFLTRLKLVSTDNTKLTNKYCTENDLTNIGFDKAMVLIQDLETQLRSDFSHDEYLTIGVANGYGSLRPNGPNDGRGSEYAKELDKKCALFFGKKENRNFFLNKIDGRSQFSLKPKTVFSGCDAHSFDVLSKKLGKSFVELDSKGVITDFSEITWIKAEPTFEGLRQVLFEPETRVYIGETKPREPINSIETIQLNFPQKSKVGEDDFCFAGINHNFSLSSYFNCFIGGRGAGKSTILNLMGLHSINPESPQIFWNSDGKDKKKGLNPIGFDPSDNQIFSFTGTEKFEFLAQSEIESFARDKNKFTDAIYNRANANSGNLLSIFEEKIQSSNSGIDEIINAISDLKSLEQQKINKEKEKRTLENSIKLFSSKEYKEIAESITQTTKELQDKENWTIKVNNLKDTLSSLVSDSILDAEDVASKNDFQIAYELAIDKVKEAINLLNDDNFTNERGSITALKLKLNELELNAKEITEKAGYSSDSVEQIKSAPQQISVIENEVKNLSKQIDIKNNVILRLDEIIKVLEEDKIAYEQKINEVITPLQETLKNQFDANQGKEIKHIALEYKFNEDSAWEALSTEFYDLFKSEYGDTESGKGVSNFIMENRLEFSKTLNEITAFLKDQKDRKYIQYINEVFKEKKNHQIFTGIMKKHLNDVNRNKLILVKYDNKNVDQASFGQRCTAVVVILLLFGNYPIIIDEPEAHLDSALIANYLVPLIKEKKSDRQIIFATHNANFVINGDAEKIFILKNETGKTEFIETTIENITNRPELLKLEGGKEAFEKRGEKLDVL